ACLPVTVGIDKSFLDRLFREFIKLALIEVVTLREAEKLLAAIMPFGFTFNSRHCISFFLASGPPASHIWYTGFAGLLEGHWPVPPRSNSKFEFRISKCFQAYGNMRLIFGVSAALAITDFDSFLFR